MCLHFSSLWLCMVLNCTTQGVACMHKRLPTFNRGTSVGPSLECRSFTNHFQLRLPHGFQFWTYILIRHPELGSSNAFRFRVTNERSINENSENPRSESLGHHYSSRQALLVNQAQTNKSIYPSCHILLEGLLCTSFYGQLSCK